MSDRGTTAPAGPIPDLNGGARRTQAAVRQPPAAGIDNASVAGEEDPGAALEFTRKGSTGPVRPDGIRPVRCDR